MTAQEIISKLSLEPLEGEGGFFKRILTFSSGISDLGGSIYYLITPQSFSALHLLPSDEAWYFLEGDPVEQLVLRPDGSHSLSTLGKVTEGHSAIALIEGGCYQGTRLVNPKGWALCATAMCPPFDWNSFVLADDSIVQRYADCSLVKEFLAKGV